MSRALATLCFFALCDMLFQDKHDVGGERASIAFRESLQRLSEFLRQPDRERVWSFSLLRHPRLRVRTVDAIREQVAKGSK